MNKYLDNLYYLLPIMFYYALEAVIVGLFIMIVWKAFLSNFLGNVGYLQIVAIYWIVKMLLFNVFNLIGNLNAAGTNAYMAEQYKKEKEDEV